MSKLIRALRAAWTELNAPDPVTPRAAPVLPASPAPARPAPRPAPARPRRYSQDSPEEVRARIAAKPSWYHQIEIAPGIVTPGVQPSQLILDALALPEDMNGMRVLDIGTADGFYAFECEQRGAAEVIAIDYQKADVHGFATAASLLGSKADHRVDNLYNLTPERYGQFDIVLFMGLIYHLPDPMLGLMILRSLLKPGGIAAVETHVIDFVPFSLPLPESTREQIHRTPLMQFYLDNVFNGDWTNFWAPNMACMRQMLVQTGFELITEALPMPAGRATFTCRLSRQMDETREFYLNLTYGDLLPRLQGAACEAAQPNGAAAPA